MLRVADYSRRLIPGIAFVLVMAGTGGLLGALGGVMLVLLSHIVLGLGAGISELLPVSVAIGVLSALSVGIYLMAKHTLSFNWRPALVPMANPEGEQVAS